VSDCIAANLVSDDFPLTLGAIASGRAFQPGSILTRSLIVFAAARSGECRDADAAPIERYKTSRGFEDRAAI
jgi:hypothetical protein